MVQFFMREGMACVVRYNFSLKRDERFELVRQRYASNVSPSGRKSIWYDNGLPFGSVATIAWQRRADSWR